MSTKVGGPATSPILTPVQEKQSDEKFILITLLIDLALLGFLIATRKRYSGRLTAG